MNPQRFITREQMENLTEKTLTDYGFDPYHKMIRSVPIEEIIEFHFDLQIGWEPIDHLDHDGIVMAAILPTEKQILLNETYRELFENKLGIYHFTLAHELGHWVLHASEPTFMVQLHNEGNDSFAELDGGKPFYCRSSSRKPIEEVQADLFAGCILMPRPMLERAVGQLRKMGLIQLSHLYGLADYFRVSISALSVRLTQLQLLHINQEGHVRCWGTKEIDGYEQLRMNF